MPPPFAAVLPPRDPALDDPAIVDETLAWIPNWWEIPAEPLIRPVTDVDHLAQAADRLFLASAAQIKAGGDRATADLLSRWCMDLKHPDLADVMAVLHGLDRLDRDACEPQTWLHLKAAETAVAAYVAKVQRQTSLTAP